MANVRFQIVMAKKVYLAENVQELLFANSNGNLAVKSFYYVKNFVMFVVKGTLVKRLGEMTT